MIPETTILTYRIMSVMKIEINYVHSITASPIGLGLWCLMPLSTIFKLYRGGQFYWWRKPE